VSEDHGLDSKSLENREFADMALKDERDLNSKFRLKFTMDKLFALLAGILFSPIIAFICLSIWIEGLFCRESRGLCFTGRKGFLRENVSVS
jgi:hypothetical protein